MHQKGSVPANKQPVWQRTAALCNCLAGAGAHYAGNGCIASWRAGAITLCL